MKVTADVQAGLDYARGSATVEAFKSGFKDAVGIAFNTWRRKLNEQTGSGKWRHLIGTATPEAVPPEAQPMIWTDIIASDDVKPLPEMDSETVQADVRRLRAGEELPPVVVFFDGTCYWLAEGFHRYAAVRFAGTRLLRVELRHGGKQDAIRYANDIDPKSDIVMVKSRGR